MSGPNLLTFLDELSAAGWTVQFRRTREDEADSVALELYGGPSRPVDYPQTYSAPSPSEALQMCVAAVQERMGGLA